MLGESPVCIFGLGVPVGRHEPVENLPGGQGQVVAVLSKNLLDLEHQPGGLLVRPPRCVAFGALVGVFTAWREILQSAQTEPRGHVLSKATTALDGHVVPYPPPVFALKGIFARGLDLVIEPDRLAKLLIGFRALRTAAADLVAPLLA